MPRASPQTERLVAIVRLLAAHPQESFRLSDIARRLQLDKATALPMLAALVDAGWLARRPDTKAYHLGPALVGIGNAAARRFPGSEFVRDLLLGLNERWNLTFLAFAEEAGYAILVDQVWDVRHSVPALHVGQRFPVRAPFGAVFAAYGGESAADRWLAEVPAGQRDAYRAGLARLRAEGYGVELRTAELDALAPPDARPDPAADAPQQLIARVLDTAVTEPAAFGPHLHPDVLYPVATVTAPVLRRSRAVALAVVATGFRRSLPGRQVRELAEDMRARTDRMTLDLREPALSG